MNNEILRQATLLIARVGIGTIFIAHGWQKLFTKGLSATAEGFASMGIPLPTVSAYITTFLEIVGGGLVVLGLFTSVVSALLASTMMGALVFAHREDGLVGGYEFVLTLGLLCLVPVAFGPGRLSLTAAIRGTTNGLRSRRQAELTS